MSSVLKTEAHLSLLPYVSESCLTALPGMRGGKRIAALVRFRDSTEPEKRNLLTIRSDLFDHMPEFRLPTELRVLRDGEDIPRSIYGKIRRDKVADEYFPVSEKGTLPEDVEVWYWDY